jgi:hypothetical protein
MFRLDAAAADRKMNRQDLSLRKELWLDGCLGVEPRRMGLLWLKASATWG